MKAAIYARKSTEEKDVAEDAKSVNRQVEGARAFISKKGWTLDERHIYTDDGVSGALFASREHFQRVMHDASTGAFDHIVFFDLDRFGRNARQTMSALNTLADLGVTIWDYSTGVAVDLDSFEGEMMTFMKARFAQQYRDQVRKHTRDAMRKKAEQDLVTGGRVFGYDNVRISKGITEHRINEAEAAVVRDIYTRFAAGEGLRTIALMLNRAGVPSIRAQRGRKRAWGPSTVRAVLDRPLYRGEYVWGLTVSAYGRELGKRKTLNGTPREAGQIPTPKETWFKSNEWADRLRIIDADLAARVDVRRVRYARRYVQADGRSSEKAHGKYLLSGGMLICPTCGGFFEALKSPWREGGVYLCATRRRKPGVCTNMLTLPIAKTDDTVLTMIEGEVLGTRFIEDLLALVDRGEVDDIAHLRAERDRLRAEIHRLVECIASGDMPAAMAPAIKKREVELAQLEVRLSTPTPAQINIDELREALQQRAAQWKTVLRNEPKVARLLLRRLVGPLTLWDKEDPGVAWVEWEASLTPGLLEGLVPSACVPCRTSVASPSGFEPEFCL